MTLRLGLLLAAALLGGSAAPAPLREPPTPVAVITEINIARSRPADYAEALRRYRGYFQGKIVRYPGNPGGLITAEGVAAVDEAIADLGKRGAVPLVQPSDLLALAARDFVLEQGPLGTTGHVSADGSRAGGRVKKRGGESFVAETITYGPSTAVEVVRQLIVDDGVRDRGHRRIALAGEFLYAGAACGPHKVYGTMCVADFARTPNGAP
ncbi:MAG: CAP domain-containing protein [Pseudomonadota bacterium]